VRLTVASIVVDPSTPARGVDDTVIWMPLEKTTADVVVPGVVVAGGAVELAVITEAGRALIEKAAPLHVAEVRKVFIDYATPAQLDLLIELGDQVRARLAEIDQAPR
jgi:hypothetical protein